MRESEQGGGRRKCKDEDEEENRGPGLDLGVY